jgi:hypothetical protein
LTNAVRFVFPKGFTLAPGDFTLVVENSAFFAARYQTLASPYYYPGLTVAGEWVGALDNAGEILSLVTSNGLELASVPYQTGGDWPERADSKGSSLELENLPAITATESEVRAFLADGKNWASSALYHGSPGRFDNFVKAVRLSEILANSEPGVSWVELVNTGSRPVELPECALTDNLDLPSQWTFPTNSVLQPGQYQVISNDQLGFAFKRPGNAVFLLQLSGHDIIRFLDSVDFPAAEPEVSFGLFQRSDGVFDFTEQQNNTPGAANALPRVGPVVISEILFSPSPGQAGFIELANVTSVPVPLYDPDRPTNVWKLEGVAFALPPGTVIQPCSTLLLCSTNAGAFRLQYGLMDSTPVLGPWPGTLNPNGETLKLLRPGPPDSDGTVPYYRVDHVSYRPNAPWPKTTAGVSLERVPLEAYGNDPASWQPGPVSGTPGIPFANRPPMITITGHPIVSQLAPLTVQVTVADLDAPWQSVALTPTQLPPGSSFDPVSGSFYWTPSLTQQPDNYPVQFLATDHATCASSQVTLQFVVQVAPALVASSHDLEGVMQLNFFALPNEAYRVEYCTDLTVADWRLLREIRVPESGIVTVSDPEWALNSTRFYRLCWLR